jgi:hypothetical protein
VSSPCDTRHAHARARHRDQQLTGRAGALRRAAYSGAIGGEVDFGASWIHGAVSDNPLVALRDRQKIATLLTNWNDTRLFGEDGASVSLADFGAAANDVHSVFQAVRKARGAWSADRDLAAALSEADESGKLHGSGAAQWYAAAVARCCVVRLTVPSRAQAPGFDVRVQPCPLDVDGVGLVLRL